ncbi:putative MFS maltose permease [Naematelia encephala]|uniref:Putative MFS maltose permease n=1 Tax=Naematelia encephala TaxID=71784 RepID=A0A1Y2B0E2_9TREE|nr:putative MFS maltose permease [Naematelia encephala]
MDEFPIASGPRTTGDTIQHELPRTRVLDLEEDRISRAKVDAALQENMSIKAALKKYPQAVIWSVLMTSATLMESYDYGLMGNFFGLPAFQKKYGDELPSGKFNVSAPTQTELKQVTKAGQIVGLLLAGYLCDRIGYRWTQTLALALIVPIILLQFMAPNVGALIAAQTLIGIPLGAFLTLSNVYASEVSPICLRPYLTTYTQICWTVGGFISTGILRGFVNNKTEWAYRIPFAVQWCWIPFIFVIMMGAPESPVWCVKKGKLDRARAALRRLSSKHEPDDDMENRLAYMQYTNEVELLEARSVSYLECFRGTNLRRTEIACAVYSIQPLCGFSLGNSSTYFLEQAGLNSASAFDVGLGGSGLALVCIFIAWPLLKWYGRRTLLLIGLVIIMISQIGIGALGIPKPSSATAWATGGFCYLFTIPYNITVGPLSFLLITDMPTSRLRPKTAVLARSAYIGTTVFNVILTNYQINATAWNWRGKSGFFWAGSCFLCLIWTYFRLPETRNRLATELDVMFEARIPARQFASTKVDAVSNGESYESEEVYNVEKM